MSFLGVLKEKNWAEIGGLEDLNKTDTSTLAILNLNEMNEKHLRNLE